MNKYIIEMKNNKMIVNKNNRKGVIYNCKDRKKL